MFGRTLRRSAEQQHNIVTVEYDDYKGRQNYHQGLEPKIRVDILR